tara:strand:+ start:194 stop:559 length:366 start_codon:yes stop_codon:yes gene_type:complete
MANKKSKFYKIVKWSTWCWAIFGTAVIIYAYTLLWDFKQYAESYNDINAVQLTWAKPDIEPIESWRVVVDFCLGEHCGRMEGSDLYYNRNTCDAERQSIVEDTMDVGGVWAYRCVETVIDL